MVQADALPKTNDLRSKDPETAGNKVLKVEDNLYLLPVCIRFLCT